MLRICANGLKIIDGDHPARTENRLYKKPCVSPIKLIQMIVAVYAHRQESRFIVDEQ